MNRPCTKQVLALVVGRHPKQAQELGLGLEQFMQARSVHVMVWEMREVKRAGASVLTYLAVRAAGRKHAECMEAIELGRSMLVLGANKKLLSRMQITSGGGFIASVAQANIDLWSDPELNRFDGAPGGADSPWVRASTVPHQVRACYKATLELGATHKEIMSAWASGIDPGVYQSVREVLSVTHKEVIDAYEHTVMPQVYRDGRLSGMSHMEAVVERSYEPSRGVEPFSYVEPSDPHERSWLDRAKSTFGSMMVNLETLHPRFASDSQEAIKDAVDERLANGQLVLPKGVTREMLLIASGGYAHDIREAKAPLMDVESTISALDNLAGERGSSTDA